MLRQLSFAMTIAGALTSAAHAHGIWTAQRLAISLSSMATAPETTPISRKR